MLRPDVRGGEGGEQLAPVLLPSLPAHPAAHGVGILRVAPLLLLPRAYRVIYRCAHDGRTKRVDVLRHEVACRRHRLLGVGHRVAARQLLLLLVAGRSAARAGARQRRGVRDGSAAALGIERQCLAQHVGQFTVYLAPALPVVVALLGRHAVHRRQLGQCAVVGVGDDRPEQLHADAWLQVGVLRESDVAHQLHVDRPLALDVEVLVEHACRLEQQVPVQVEGVGLLPHLGELPLPLGVGLQEQQQRVYGSSCRHEGVLHHAVHALLLGGVVAVGGDHVQPAALVERHGEHARLVRDHAVELYLLADAYQAYRLHVLLGHLLHARLRGHERLAVLALSDLLQALGDVGMRQPCVLLGLARRADRRGGDVGILPAQAVVLSDKVAVERRSQQGLQRHRLLFFQIAEELLRAVPPCGGHHRLYLVGRCYKHGFSVFHAIYFAGTPQSRAVPLISAVIIPILATVIHPLK